MQHCLAIKCFNFVLISLRYNRNVLNKFSQIIFTDDEDEDVFGVQNFFSECKND